MSRISRARLRAAQRHPRHQDLIRRLHPTEGANAGDALGPVEANFDNWVRMWVDPRPAHRSDCGQVTVLRGITWEGQPMWLVQHAQKRFGYHAATECPRTAIDVAEKAWAERRRVRAHWPQVRRIARDLMLGRRKLEVRIEDAHASALCTVGIEGFLSRIGMRRWTKVSGRTAAVMMLLEPQVGFVILAAYERVHGPLPPPTARPPKDNTGLRIA